jgi:hypothetical protein
MTHVKIEAQHTGDERWIEAGPDAFAVHVWALIHCDQQMSDGRISKTMAERVALLVPLDRVRPAIEALVAVGFWETTDAGYLVRQYDSYALSKREIEQTKGRWADDRKRRRWHANGVHALCVPDKCRGAMSTPDSAPDSGGVSAPQYQTRPDPTEGRGSGAGADTSGACAPTVRATEESCTHGLVGGFVFRNGKPMCELCDALVPDSLDFIAGYQEQIDDGFPGVAIDQLAKRIVTDTAFTSTTYASAARLAEAVRKHHGTAEPDAWKWIFVRVLEATHPGCVVRTLKAITGVAA